MARGKNNLPKPASIVDKARSSITRLLPFMKKPAKSSRIGTYSAISASRRRVIGAKRVQSRSRRAKLLTVAASAALGLAILFTVGVVGMVLYFSKDLPSPNELTNREVVQSTKIYDRHGELLYDVYDGQHNRTLLAFNEIPQVMKDATVAAEDKYFYEHQGYSVQGIALAFVKLLSSRSIEGGGSTITQQLVKNAILEDSRQTPVRKIKELILAIQIERRYTKDQILQIYLNEIPYGGTAYGVEAAAHRYFNKSATKLTLPEAAMLAGIVQSPTMHDPYIHPDSAYARQHYVLEQMYKNGMITKEQRTEAEDKKLAFSGSGSVSQLKAPHFVFYVKQLLEEQYGSRLVEQGGLRVTTTLDYKKQVIAEEEIKKQLANLAKANANATSAALIASQPSTGEILAYVGSGDFYDDAHDGKVDAIQRKLQPGSSVKPFTYLQMLNKGYTLATYLGDVKTCFGGGYCPGNSDGRYWGPLMVRESLSNSRNIPAVKATQLVGVDGFIDMAQTLGITSLTNRNQYGLSIGLGAVEVTPFEMARAYNTLANKGVEQDLTAILKVEDSTGKVLERYEPSDGRRVVDEKNVYLITDVLSDNQARRRLFGSNNQLEIGRPAAVKTGTTDENWDAWTIGFTPSLSTAVWVGNMDHSPMRGIQGSTGATPIWHGYMKRALQNTPAEQFKRPSSIVAVTVDAISGKLPVKGSKTRTELFVKGTEPTTKDTFSKVVQVDKENGLLANEVTIATGNAKEVRCIQLEELVKAWQPYTDAWMKAQGSPYGCPTKTSEISHTVGERPYVKIVQPGSGDTLPLSFEVTATAVAAHNIAKVEFLLNGVAMGQVSNKPYKYRFNLSDSMAGSQTITVRATDFKGNEGSDSIEVEIEDE